MAYPHTIKIAEAEVFKSYTVEGPLVGSRAELEDGRIFRFSECGAAALVAGNLHQGVVPGTNYSDEAVATMAAGATVLTGVGSTAANAAAGLLKNGYCFSDSATAANFMPAHRVKNNTLITAGSALGTITLFTPLALPLAEGSTISYFQNLWRDVIIHDSPATAMQTGVAPIALAANAFGWLQTRGVCAVAYNATTTAIAAVNDPVCGCPQVDGAVSGLAAGTAETNPTIGYAVDTIQADTEMTVIFLVIE